MRAYKIFKPVRLSIPLTLAPADATIFPKMDEMAQLSKLEELKRRLGPADKEQIRLLLRVSPEQRLQTMLDMQDIVLSSWLMRLRRAHPELNDLDLCRLMFKRLQQNG